jgi:hypothetical protein
VGVVALPVSPLARGAILAVAGISFPVWYDLNLGNLSIVLFMLSALVWRYHDRPAGSIALAVAGVLRYPFGIVLLGWAVARRLRQVGWTVVAGLAICAATVLAVGLTGWTDYVAALTTLGDVSSGPHNLSFATTAQAFGLPGPQAAWVLLGIGLALAVTVFAALRRDPATAAVVSLAATILFFPFFHPHYLVQLLIPAAFLAGRGQWWGLVLPLLGWLPGELMPLAATAGVLAPLAPRRLGSLSAGGGRRGAGAESGTGPTPP